MTTAQHQAIVRRVIEELWNEDRLDVADELFAPDFVNHGGLIPDLLHGPEAVKISVVLFRRAFPELHISLDELRSDGELVLLRWTARATHRSSASPANGATRHPGELTGQTCSRVAGGKIVESWTEWDQTTTLGRLLRA